MLQDYKISLSGNTHHHPTTCYCHHRPNRKTESSEMTRREHGEWCSCKPRRYIVEACILCDMAAPFQVERRRPIAGARFPSSWDEIGSSETMHLTHLLRLNKETAFVAGNGASSESLDIGDASFIESYWAGASGDEPEWIAARIKQSGDSRSHQL